jgi:hypothetical protein
LRHGPAAVDLEENSSKVLIDGDRRVTDRIDTAGDPALELAKGDLVGDVNRRFEAGSACLLDVVRRGPRRESRPQHRLPGQIEVSAVLEHRSSCDFTEALVL